MADLYETVNILSVLLGARRPQWATQAAYSGIPAAPSAGVSLENSPRTQIIVDLREEVHRRTVRITVPVADLLVGVYRVVVGVNTVDYDASVSLPADAAALVQGIADGIAASAPANTIVAATAVDSTGGGGPVDTILLRGLGELAYSIGLAVIGGTGEMAGIADALTAVAHVWFAALPPNAPGTWRRANGATYNVDARGFIERFDTAGLDRAYVELRSVTGHGSDGAVAPTTLTYAPVVTLGPSVLETN